MNYIYGFNNQMNQQQQFRPNLKIMNEGYVINNNELNTITNCSINAYLNKAYRLSSNASHAINVQFVVNPLLAWALMIKGFDFSLTCAKTIKVLYLLLIAFYSQESRLK